MAAAAALKRNDWGSFILSFPSSLDARSTILHPSFLPSLVLSFCLSFPPRIHYHGHGDGGLAPASSLGRTYSSRTDITIIIIIIIIIRQSTLS